jgi:hypothetical protein
MSHFPQVPGGGGGGGGTCEQTNARVLTLDALPSYAASSLPRYRFATDINKPELMGAPGRVYASLEVYICAHICIDGT